METDISSLQEVTAAAEKAEQFCMKHGNDPKISNHIALCIEEMAANVIQYGFKDEKQHHLSILVLSKPEFWVLRFRDDCRAFNPVRYVPQAEEKTLGIRIVMSLAEDAHYTYSMNLNNLTLKLPKVIKQNPVQ